MSFDVQHDVISGVATLPAAVESIRCILTVVPDAFTPCSSSFLRAGI